MTRRRSNWLATARGCCVWALLCAAAASHAMMVVRLDAAADAADAAAGDADAAGNAVRLPSCHYKLACDHFNVNATLLVLRSVRTLQQALQRGDEAALSAFRRKAVLFREHQHWRVDQIAQMCQAAGCAALIYWQRVDFHLAQLRCLAYWWSGRPWSSMPVSFIRAEDASWIVQQSALRQSQHSLTVGLSSGHVNEAEEIHENILLNIVFLLSLVWSSANVLGALFKLLQFLSSKQSSGVKFVAYVMMIAEMVANIFRSITLVNFFGMSQLLRFPFFQWFCSLNIIFSILSAVSMTLTLRHYYYNAQAATFGQKQRRLSQLNRSLGASVCIVTLFSLSLAYLFVQSISIPCILMSSVLLLTIFCTSVGYISYSKWILTEFSATLAYVTPRSAYNKRFEAARHVQLGGGLLSLIVVQLIAFSVLQYRGPNYFLSLICSLTICSDALSAIHITSFQVRGDTRLAFLFQWCVTPCSGQPPLSQLSTAVKRRSVSSATAPTVAITDDDNEEESCA